jgi:predicted 2-oxoglutarate/Fe(II)-dependent dioxygenase YbiX
MSSEGAAYDVQALFALTDGVISLDERQSLFRELANTESAPAGLVHWDGTSGADSRTRKAGIHNLAKGHWLEKRMLQGIEELNQRLWKMSLEAPEGIQVLDYDREGHYVWHFDVLPTAAADDLAGFKGTNRVLTAVLNLTDEAEYTLGDLLLHDPVAGTRSPGFHGCGAMIVFPSNHWHRATAVTSGFRRVAVLWVRGDLALKENAYVGEFAKSMERATPSVPQTCNGPVGIPSDDGLIVYRPYTNHVYLLDGIAGLIWEARTQKLSGQEIAADLAEHYHVSQESVRDDIEFLEQQWEEAGIAPDETAGIVEERAEQVFTDSQTCNVSNTLIRVGYEDAEVRDLLWPLLLPLAVDATEFPIRDIRVIEKNGQHRIDIDGGAPRVLQRPTSAASSVLSELQSLGVSYGGASLSLGAGAIAIGNRALVMPGLLNKGRVALLFAMSKRYEAPILASSCLPYYRGNGMVESLPLPLKMRRLDVELLGSALPAAPSPTWFGTESDPVTLIPWPSRIPNDGRRYSIAAVLFAKHGDDSPTRLDEMDPMVALARTMESGSYFIHSAHYQDYLQLSLRFRQLPTFELSYANFESAWSLLDPLFERLAGG